MSWFLSDLKEWEKEQSLKTDQKSRLMDHFFCNYTGEAIKGNTKFFQCMQCQKTYKLKYRFGSRPICQICAKRSGVALRLQHDREQAKEIGEQVIKATEQKFDNWLSNKLESRIKQFVKEAVNEAMKTNQFSSGMRSLPAQELPAQSDYSYSSKTVFRKNNTGKGFGNFFKRGDKLSKEEEQVLFFLSGLAVGDSKCRTDIRPKNMSNAKRDHYLERLEEAKLVSKSDNLFGGAQYISLTKKGREYIAKHS